MRLLPFLALASSLALLVSCSSTTPDGRCQQDSDCAFDQRCVGGACVERQPTGCTAGQTRPCGNPEVGACRRGTQRCVNGAFEAACTGEVTPTTETCNGVDDDCDGQVDDGVASTFVVDSDGDGFGSASANAQTVEACSAPAGFVATRTDCDDAVAAINPSATEACDGMGVDEDCDGTPNEGCACNPPGAMQPCCGGRGFQTCDTVGGGTAWSACNAPGVAEVCNGLDDDCDGQVDEMAFLGGPDGGAAELDGGSARPDGTCTLGQGACAATGMTSCAAGALVCSATPGTPGSETCNGQDDDCDGQVDEGLTLAACTVGTGACARQGTQACVGGALSCAATPGTPTAETCNGLDDDCDGQVDEAGPGLCTVTGQTCAGATCACPSGQSVCNGACATLSAEVCDGQDNDCDGQVDEGVLITCLPDTDNDRYAGVGASVQHCPDASRPAFGFCPAGFVAAVASLGTDCNDTDDTRYRVLATRTDADGDGRCVGTSATSCVGATAGAGRRFPADCAAADDCNDGNAGLFQLITARFDDDNDGWCQGTSVQVCAGASLTAPYRAASSCLGEDCNNFNRFATAACTLPNFYATTYNAQSCPQGRTEFNVTPVTTCPQGFSISINLRAEKASGSGFCEVVNATRIAQTCNFLDGSVCRVVADCVANLVE